MVRAFFELENCGRLIKRFIILCRRVYSVNLAIVLTGRISSRDPARARAYGGAIGQKLPVNDMYSVVRVHQRDNNNQELCPI